MSTLNVIHQRILAISIGRDVTKNIGAYFAALDAALEESFPSDDLRKAKDVLMSVDQEFMMCKRSTKRTRKNALVTKTRKPLTCGWTLFLRHTVEELKATNFEGKIFTKVSESWNALDVAAKQTWKDKATAINTIPDRKKIRIEEPWL